MSRLLLVPSTPAERLSQLDALAASYDRAADHAARWAHLADAGMYRDQAETIRAEAAEIAAQSLFFCEPCDLVSNEPAPVAEARFLADVHNGLHHGGFPCAALIPA